MEVWAGKKQVECFILTREYYQPGLANIFSK